MLLVTSCPACDTRFHVKPEQLAAHAGDLRCGHCQHTFNAGPRLYEILAPQALVALPTITPHDHPTPTDAVAFTDATGSYAQTFSPEPVETEAILLPQEDADDLPPGETAATILPDNFNSELIAAELDPATTTILDINHGESVDTESDQVDIPAETNAVQHAAEEPETSRQQASAAPATSSFLASKEPAKHLSRWLTVPLALLLVLGLLLQSLYFLRTPLAGYWPSSRPALEAVCQWLGCTVSLPRNPELLALDDSDLQEDFEHPDVIQLSTKLINNATYLQDYPLLELTLTNDNDQPKLRRVFSPQEYLPTDTDIKAGLAADEEIQINLAFSTGGEQVSGYRVFVTY